MAFTKETIVEDAKKFGFTGAALVDISTLKTMEEVRNMCAEDKCNAYGKNWTCPPVCGSIADCEEKMKKYDWGVLVQVTAEMEDSMDYEAMMEGMENLRDFGLEMTEALREVYDDILPLSAGYCNICKKCAYPDAPCRFPEKAFSAMEGYGLLVSQVCQDNNLPYYYGPNTVTYTGMFLIKE